MTFLKIIQIISKKEIIDHIIINPQIPTLRKYLCFSFLLQVIFYLLLIQQLLVASNSSEWVYNKLIFILGTLVFNVILGLIRNYRVIHSLKLYLQVQLLTDSQFVQYHSKIDQKMSTNTTGQTSKINPFLKKNTTTNNSNTQASKVCQFFSNIPTPSFNNLYKPANYQNTDLESDIENKPQNIILTQSYARLNHVNLIKQKQSRKKTANLIANSEVPPKISIKLSVNGNLCDVNQKQLRLFSDFSVMNTSMTKNSLSLANMRTEKIKVIKNHLSRLFLTIQSSNLSLLKKAKNKINPFRDYEIARLLQGLVFFKPNQKFQILAQVFNKHILGEQVKEIAKNYNLDYLKAYYAIKQVYIQKNILSQYTNDFTVKIDKNMIIDIKTLVSLVGQFLNTDKKNLLMIYGSYLSSDKKPSKTGACGIRQEINILWGNLHMMQNQSLQIQQMVFEIYKKQSQYQHVEKYVKVELEAMRKRFELVNQNFSNKLVQMSIQRMLDQGRFNLSQCKGHYLDLITLLVNRQPLNFQAAIQRLENVDLQQKWFEYFRTYIKELSFDQQKQHQEIMRACYLYKLYKMFCSKNLFLEKELQEKLVKSISTKCSIILALRFIELIQNKLLKVYILKLLLKYSQGLMLQKEVEDSKIINKLLPLINNPSSIIALIIDFIQGTFEEFIKSKDLQLLQIQLSSGRKIIHSYFLTEAPLETIMYYICIFYKFVSFSSKIQKNIENILKLLKEHKCENISSSIRYYNDKMITRLVDPKMIASHLVFMVQMTVQALKKTEYIQKWLQHIQRLGLNENFDQFIVVLSKSIEDVESNTQIQIKLHTIQLFLNCFKNAIMKFINQHTTPQNLNKKLNLYTLFIKVSEWQNLISQVVPESIQIFKLHLKTQIQSLVSKFYDKLSLSGQKMSQKLIIIYQFITSESFFNDNMDFSFSLLSDIVRKQKQVSTFQLYNMITQQLLKQSGLQPLVALYFITQLQPNLAKLLVNEIGLHFCSSLKQQSYPSLITIQKIIKLSINLFSYFSPKFKMQQKQKLKVLFRLIQDRIYLWLKNKKMTAVFFRSLFDLLCVCKNSIPYEYHITYLINAKRQNLLFAFTLQQYKRINLHMLYILSLKISKKSCLVDVSNEQQIQQLQEQLQVFTQMQLNLLNHFAKEQNSQNFDQYSQRYMSKLNKVLFQCANQPLLSQIVVSLLRKINETLCYITSKSSSNIFFKKQKTAVQKYLQQSSNFQRGLSSLYKPYQFLRCARSKDFNQILSKSLNKLTLNPQNESGELQMSKMISFIENNPEHILDFVNISSRHIQSKSIDLLFLQLINKILSKLNPNYYGQKQNKNAIKDILNQLISSLCLFDDLHALRLNRQIIYTINSILQNSLLSPFQVSTIFSPTITEILHILRQILFKWTPCNIPSLHYLGQISLILSHYPTGTNYNKNFTLWNLVSYRQKLYLINQILQYARQVNGLLDIKKYELIDIIVEFTIFLVLNQPNFQTKQTQQKIAGINKMLQPYPMSPSNLNNFISNDLSIAQLKQSAWHIVQQLNYLNIGYTSKQAEFFEHFSPNIGE